MDITLSQPKTNIQSERAYVVSLFVEAINAERPASYKVNGKKKTLGKVSPRGVAIKLSHIPTNDLYPFLSECKDYKNRNGSFAKYFYGALKIR